jgi:hypothetical protein
VATAVCPLLELEEVLVVVAGQDIDSLPILDAMKRISARRRRLSFLTSPVGSPE